MSEYLRSNWNSKNTALRYLKCATIHGPGSRPREVRFGLLHTHHSSSLCAYCPFNCICWSPFETGRIYLANTFHMELLVTIIRQLMCRHYSTHVNYVDFYSAGSCTGIYVVNTQLKLLSRLKSFDKLEEERGKSQRSPQCWWVWSKTHSSQLCIRLGSD